MKNLKNINIGQFTDSFQVPSVISKEDAWKLLESKINTEKNSAAKRNTIIINWKIVSLVSAAAVIVFVLWFGLNKIEKYSPAITTSIAENKTCWLPDSSKVQLNFNSSLTYNFNKLTGKRNVIVNGDALFEVKKGKEFIVGFSGGQVKVKGTAFYVSAYSSDWLQVDCFEGAVEVTIKNQNFIINKGKGIRMYKEKITGPYFCDESDIRDRLNGVFYWSRISLSEIADLIGYRFGYTTIIDSSLQNRNFSGRLDLNELQQGLMVISMAMNVDYIINEDQKTISLNAK
jgi:transmembrane sensor